MSSEAYMAQICVCLNFCGQVEGGQYNMGLYLVWWRTKLVLYLIIRPKKRYNGTSARKLQVWILLSKCPLHYSDTKLTSYHKTVLHTLCRNKWCIWFQDHVIVSNILIYVVLYLAGGVPPSVEPLHLISRDCTLWYSVSPVCVQCAVSDYKTVRETSAASYKGWLASCWHQGYNQNQNRYRGIKKIKRLFPREGDTFAVFSSR